MWNDKFESPDEPYSVSVFFIVCFESIIKKHETLIDNPPSKNICKQN